MSDTLEQLYNRITGDEDARVCKDIPASACNDQPRNYFAYLLANLLGKVADEIASAKLVIPWLFASLGVPAAFTGFLVPIREAGVLLPQLAVAAAVRHIAIRKTVWLLGAVLSALSLFGMAVTAYSLQGAAAGGMILLMLVIFSLSRGICSVSAKDVLGKTVSKSRRGSLMGWSASLSGILIILVGLYISTLEGADDAGLFAGLLITGGILWLLATLSFGAIREQAGSTEGGENALSVAVAQLQLLRSDQAFRQFVIVRTLLLSVALALPFYVIVAKQQSDAGVLGLGALMIANGLASSLSAPFWGYLGDRSSRTVMAAAAGGAGLLGVVTFIAVALDWQWMTGEIGFAVIFFVISVMHSGVRLGRKVYLVDMATADNRAAYVAVSNTVIGIMMFAGGLVGILADWLGAAAIVLILGLFTLIAAASAGRLPDVSAKPGAG